MNTYVVLLRGINVGGRNKLLMKQLAVILEGLGCVNVKTYIQSGNVVLQSDNNKATELSENISQAINQQYDFKPHVHILTAKDLQQAIDNNPYPEAKIDPKTLHFGFLDVLPSTPNLDKLAELKTTTENYQLINKVFYLNAPDGIGRSKLATQSEKALGVSMTSRNWRTVEKIQDMLIALEKR
jgi:uncharacterized protein (DUF1697 family)